MRYVTTHNRHPFFRDFDRFFDTVFDAPVASERFFPTVDIQEDKDHFLLNFDLPGMKQEDLNIEVENGVLTVSGERKAEFRNEEGKRTRWERSYGKFSRQFQLGDRIDSDAIEANYQDGVLSLYVPKVEAVKPKTIEVKTNKEGFFTKLLSGEKTA